MFNFLVTAAEGAWNGEPYVFGQGRFLEFTAEDLKKQFRGLDATALAPLRGIPSLFAYEDIREESARVGWLKGIQVRGGETRVSYALDPSIAPILPARLKDLAWDLDIGGGELSRTHWAVKAPDLLEVLSAHGMLPQELSSAVGPALAFSRSTIINACDFFQLLSHADLDRLLLEFGVGGLRAGRERGSLRARANAIAEYVLAHLQEATADGQSLPAAVVKKAAEIDSGYPDAELPGISPATRIAFWTGMERDGCTIRDGVLVPTQGFAVPPYVLPRRVALGPPPLSRPFDHIPDLTPMPPARAEPAAQEVVSPAKDKVFLVHGRDHGAKETVARYLERLGIEVVILHERPNQGRTLISKFREESADVRFAVVLMTPDDIGGLKPAEGSSGTDLAPRARQNVVFELGFFIGKLGPGQVCALVTRSTEKPSDFEAVVYIEWNSTDSWKIELARELGAAGIRFDPLRVLGLER